MMAEHKAGPQAADVSGVPHPSGVKCTFCNKGYEAAGPLVEAPQAGLYICYACARLCAYIIEQECQLRGLPVPDW
jgi:hypothetical protein